MGVSLRTSLQPSYVFLREANQAINITHLAPPRQGLFQGQQPTPLQKQLWQQQQLLQQQHQMGMPQPFTYNTSGFAATNSFSAGFVPFQPQPQTPFALQPQMGMNMAMPQVISHNSPGPAATNSFSAGPAPFQFELQHQMPPQLPPQDGFQQQHFPTPAPAPQPQQQPQSFPIAAAAAATSQPKRKRGRPSHASLGKLTAKEKRYLARTARREPPAPKRVPCLPDLTPVAGHVGVPGNYTPHPPAAQNAATMQQVDNARIDALAADPWNYQPAAYDPTILDALLADAGNCQPDAYDNVAQMTDADTAEGSTNYAPLDVAAQHDGTPVVEDPNIDPSLGVEDNDAVMTDDSDVFDCVAMYAAAEQLGIYNCADAYVSPKDMSVTEMMAIYKAHERNTSTPHWEHVAPDDA